MIKYKDTVKNEIKGFEQELAKAKDIAKKQKVPSKVDLYKKIYQMQRDLEILKASLRMYIIEKKRSSRAHMPNVEADRKVVKKDYLELQKDLPDKEKNKDFSEIFTDTCKEISNDIRKFYDDTKALTNRKKAGAKETAYKAILNIEKKIDVLDQKVKNRWYSMTDSVKRKTSAGMGALKENADDMKNWLKKKF